jgi:hypothetical protein
MAEPGALAYLHAALPPAPGQHGLSHQGGLARAMAAVSDRPGPADLPRSAGLHPSAGLPPSGAGLTRRGPSRRVSASDQRGTAVATAAAAGAPDASPAELAGALAAPRARLSSPGALAGQAGAPDASPAELAGALLTCALPAPCARLSGPGGLQHDAEERA